MKCHLIIPAAGVGRRFGATMPKQYAPLLGDTVFGLTLTRLLEAAEWASIVVAVSADDPFYTDYAERFPKVKFVTGGADRADSVLKALEAIESASDDDWVAVHDAARPCVREQDVQALLAACQQSDEGAVLGREVTDTIKQQTSAGWQTVDRSDLRAVQTPQCFPRTRLLSALRSAQSEGYRVTDEASAMEQAGFQYEIVIGAGDNLKITHAEDLALAHFYLQQQGVSNV